METPEIDVQTVNRLRRLAADDSGARQFFEAAAGRQNEYQQKTSIERLSQLAGVSYAEGLELAKTFQEFGVGRYVIGRRGQSTRIEWNYGLKQLGQAAIRNGTAGGHNGPQSSTDALTQAKYLVANAFGVAPEAVEITIRA